MSRGWHEGYCVKKVSKSCQDFAKTVTKEHGAEGQQVPLGFNLNLKMIYSVDSESGIAFCFGFAKTHMTRMISEFFDHGPGIVVTDTE